MKKRTIYITIGIIAFFFMLRSFFSGQKEEPVVTLPERSAQIVETQVVGRGEFRESIHVTGRIAPTREVVVSTQGTGFVGSIQVEAGQHVGAGQVMATLADSYGTSTNSIAEADLGVSGALLSQESALSNLDQALESARIAYEKAQKDYDASRLTTPDDVYVSRAQLDLQNYITTQEKTLSGYEKSYQNQVQNLQSFLANVIDSVDTLLGVTPEKEPDNDHYEYLLSALDSQKKQDAEAIFRQLLKYKTWKPNMTLSLPERITEIQSIYQLVNDVLSAVEVVLIKSITDASLFTEVTRSGYRTLIDSYQTQFNASFSGLVTFLNTIEGFLATYQNERLSREKSVQTTAENSKSSLELAKKSYETALRAYDIGVRQSGQGLSLADIRLRAAQGSAGRLVVTAPFSGIVMTKNVEIGSLATPGFSLFTLGDISRLVANVDIGVDQKKYLKVGQSISLDFGDEIVSGKLTSLSAGPDPKTHLYHAEITLPVSHPEIALGDIVDVLLPGAPASKLPENQPIVIPFSALKYLGEDTYAVSVVEMNATTNTSIARERVVKIGDMNEDSVTILEGLAEGERIVIRGGLGVDDGDEVEDVKVKSS